MKCSLESNIEKELQQEKKLEAEYENILKEKDVAMKDLRELRIRLKNANNRFDELQIEMKLETERLNQFEKDCRNKDMTEKQNAESVILEKRRDIEALEKQIQALKEKTLESKYANENEIKGLLEANQKEIDMANLKIKSILDKKRHSIYEKQKEFSTLQGKMDELDLQLDAARKQQLMNTDSNKIN